MFERWVVRSDAHGRADVIDVCNEPNGQLWPQRGPSTATSTIEGRFRGASSATYRVNPMPTSQLTVHKAVAEMMQTVDEFARSYHPRVLCFAPSTADSDVTANGSYRLTSKFAATPYSATLSDPFVPALLDELDRLRFKGGGRWLWSFHNYNDWERAQDRVAYLRPLLKGRWRGRTDDLGDPVLVATEGGCRLIRVPARFPRRLRAGTSRQARTDRQRGHPALRTGRRRGRRRDAAHAVHGVRQSPDSTPASVTCWVASVPPGASGARSSTETPAGRTPN